MVYVLRQPFGNCTVVIKNIIDRYTSSLFGESQDFDTVILYENGVLELSRKTAI